MFEKRVHRRIFGPKRDEVTREWRNLCNEELNDQYCSPDIRVMNSRMRWVGHVACTGEVHTGVLGGGREGKRPPGSPRQRWEYNIKMTLQGVGWEARTGVI